MNKKKILSPSVDINIYLTIGTKYLIEDLKGFDGNLHAGKAWVRICLD